MKNIAERGFDPRTSGLWAQHASTAPLCSMLACRHVMYISTTAFSINRIFKSRVLRDCPISNVIYPVGRKEKVVVKVFHCLSHY